MGVRTNLGHVWVLERELERICDHTATLEGDRVDLKQICALCRRFELVWDHFGHFGGDKSCSVILKGDLS